MEFYRVPSVRDICPDCATWANKQLDEIRSKNAPELRRRIVERISKPKPKPRRFLGIFSFSR